MDDMTFAGFMPAIKNIEVKSMNCGNCKECDNYKHFLYL